MREIVTTPPACPTCKAPVPARKLPSKGARNIVCDGCMEPLRVTLDTASGMWEVTLAPGGHRDARGSGAEDTPMLGCPECGLLCEEFSFPPGPGWRTDPCSECGTPLRYIRSFGGVGRELAVMRAPPEWPPPTALELRSCIKHLLGLDPMPDVIVFADVDRGAEEWAELWPRYREADGVVAVLEIVSPDGDDA